MPCPHLPPELRSYRDVVPLAGERPPASDAGDPILFDRAASLRSRFRTARHRVQAARAPFARPIGVIRQEGRHA